MNETAAKIHDRLVPDRLHAEVKVLVELPPEAQAVLRDLHNDRPLIGVGVGVGAAIMLVCTLIVTIKVAFGKRK